MYDDGVEGENVMPQRTDRLTYDDFLLFPDDGQRHEIIDGAHYVTPSPSPRHQELLGRLHFEIELFLRTHPGIGRVFVAPLDVVFTKWDVVEPDLLFIAATQDRIVTDKNIQGAPALVVEIASPGTRKRDEHIKQQLFDRGGVRDYWSIRIPMRCASSVARPTDRSRRSPSWRARACWQRRCCPASRFV